MNHVQEMFLATALGGLLGPVICALAVWQVARWKLWKVIREMDSMPIDQFVHGAFTTSHGIPRAAKVAAARGFFNALTPAEALSLVLGRGDVCDELDRMVRSAAAPVAVDLPDPIPIPIPPDTWFKDPPQGA